MNGQELKYYLGLHAKKHGIKSLCKQERDFLQGRIGYNDFIADCFEEYIQDKTVCTPPFRPVYEDDLYD